MIKIPGYSSFKLRKAIKPKRGLIYWLNAVAWVLSAWISFYPHPFVPVLLAGSIFPVAALFLNGLTHPNISSLVEIKQVSKKTYVNPVTFITIPACALFIRSLLQFDPDNWGDWIKTGSIGFALTLAVLFGLYRLADKENKERNGSVLMIVLLLALYSYPAVMSLNCVLDHSTPKVYHVKVVDKTRGKHGYSFILDKWGRHTGQTDIDVGSSQYYNTNIGQAVSIDLKKGYFGIAWYDVE